MTDNEQRIAIAEVVPALLKGGFIENGIPMRHLGGDRFEPFDPLNDLNAMHEAEKHGVMKYEGFFRAYVDWLVKITGKVNGGVDAEAWQRAEAFLRTVGRWKE